MTSEGILQREQNTVDSHTSAALLSPPVAKAASKNVTPKIRGRTRGPNFPGPVTKNTQGPTPDPPKPDSKPSKAVHSISVRKMPHWNDKTYKTIHPVRSTEWFPSKPKWNSKVGNMDCNVQKIGTSTCPEVASWAAMIMMFMILTTSAHWKGCMFQSIRLSMEEQKNGVSPTEFPFWCCDPSWSSKYSPPTPPGQRSRASHVIIHNRTLMAGTPRFTNASPKATARAARPF